MNRVTFTNFNEMAVEETKVQANFHLSKLNVRSREQSDTTNLSIGLEYKHIPVVCHEWCQTLHLILFSHNSITIQRAETQEAWKPSFIRSNSIFSALLVSHDYTSNVESCFCLEQNGTSQYEFLGMFLGLVALHFLGKIANSQQSLYDGRFLHISGKI